MEAILRHGAVAFSHKAQVVHRYTCQIAGGIGVLAVQLVENHAAGESALGLAHGDGGHLLTVSGHGGSHQEAVGRMKGELLYTILVVHLHRGLITPLVDGDGQAALLGEGDGQNLAAAGDPADKAMGIEHIDVGAADVIGGSNALILRYCTGGPLYSLITHHLAVFLHHQQLTVGDDGQTAVQ